MRSYVYYATNYHIIGAINRVIELVEVVCKNHDHSLWGLVVCDHSVWGRHSYLD